MLGRLYGFFSVATAVAAIAVPPATDDTVNWLIRTFFGVTLTLLGFLLKKTLDRLDLDRKRLKKVEDRAKNHHLVLKLWIEHIGQNLDSRNGNVGRRQSDVALANLLTAIRGIQEDEGDDSDLGS